MFNFISINAAWATAIKNAVKILFARNVLNLFLPVTRFLFLHENLKEPYSIVQIVNYQELP